MPERDVLALGLLSALRKGGRATAQTTALRGAHGLHRMGMRRKWAGVAVVALVNFGCLFGYVFLDMFLMFFIRKKNSIAWSFPMEASLFFEGVKPQRPSRWENRSHMNLSTATVRRLHAALARPQYRWPGPKKSQSIESTIVQEHLILRLRWKRREMRAVRWRCWRCWRCWSSEITYAYLSQQGAVVVNDIFYRHCIIFCQPSMDNSKSRLTKVPKLRRPSDLPLVACRRIFESSMVWFDFESSWFHVTHGMGKSDHQVRMPDGSWSDCPPVPYSQCTALEWWVFFDFTRKPIFQPFWAFWALLRYQRYHLLTSEAGCLHHQCWRPDSGGERLGMLNRWPPR